MDKIKQLYQNNLLYIFTKNQLINEDYDYLVIIKNDCKIKQLNNCLIMHYEDNFEALLQFTLPSKNRKPTKLISLNQCDELIHKIKYGILSFSNGDIPYAVGLNHILLNNHIYFHCANSGYKLNTINQRVNYTVIDDLGINKEIGTHNHSSVAIFGTIRQVSDFDTKKAALLQLVSDLAPKHPYNDGMVERTNILELEIDYLIGKKHFY